jgi:hypothetical protein
MGKRELLLDDAVDDVPTIKVNEDFARRFEVRRAPVCFTDIFVGAVSALTCRTWPLQLPQGWFQLPLLLQLLLLLLLLHLLSVCCMLTVRTSAFVAYWSCHVAV